MNKQKQFQNSDNEVSFELRYMYITTVCDRIICVIQYIEGEKAFKSGIIWIRTSLKTW